MTLLHISDLHFGTPYLPHVGEALLRIAPKLAADVIVVSGDLTQRATAEQFQAAREFLEQLPPVPRIVVPGNHDVPLYRVTERLFKPHALYQQYIQAELESVHRFDGAIVVALDSTAPREAISNGRIGRRRLDFCEQALAGVPEDVVKIVVAHHHFMPAPDFVHDQTMPHARRAINKFVELGVELVLGGHLHRAYIGNSLDTYPGTHRERGLIVVQCGTTTSRRGRGREREKNSFNLIKIGDEMLRVTHYMYFDALGEFAPVSRHIFPRPGRRFVEGALHHAD
ncbi:MAG: metallophosphoesterase [Pirellulales bacterium]|nr:metallophosphoesterase [Pirellulales bacterium]